MKKMKLMADYQCFPLWRVNEGDFSDYNIDPDGLPISPGLKSSLLAWAEQFDAILNWDDPASSTFPSKEAEMTWRSMKEVLVQQLNEELKGTCEVEAG